MKILIVDDEEENEYMLETLLKGNGYEVASAVNGAEALEKLRAANFDMIVSDILMPVMDGFQLCREVKNNDKLKNITVVFYSASYTDKKDEELALKAGADKLIRKPIEPSEFIKIIKEIAIDAGKGKVELKKPTLEEEKEVLKLYSERLVKQLEKKMLVLEQEITVRKRAEEELKQSSERLRRTLEATVGALASAVEMRDAYTAGHQRRVAQLVCAIAKEMNLPEEQIKGLRMAAIIHDIGKIGVPAELLSKPSRMSDIEMNLIKTHTQVGYDILKAIDFPWPIAKIVYQHHERIDALGYPLNLPGEDILLEAKIMGVADVVEAMGSHRPYRPSLGIDKALEEISQNSGVLYDSAVVDACLKVFTQGFEYEKQ